MGVLPPVHVKRIHPCRCYDSDALGAGAVGFSFHWEGSLCLALGVRGACAVGADLGMHWVQDVSGGYVWYSCMCSRGGPACTPACGGLIKYASVTGRGAWGQC